MDVIISPKLTVLLWSHQIFSGEKKKLKELKKKKIHCYWWFDRKYISFDKTKVQHFDS